MRQPIKTFPKKSRQRRAQRDSAHRLRSVRLVLGGLSAVKVGHKYGDSPRAVSIWVERFKALGEKGLVSSTRSGRPPKLLSRQMKQLEQYVTTSRKKSLRVSGGTLVLIIKKKFRTTMTRRQCERILKRLRS
jgi:transposase